jgi:signal transduction histidine kinase
VNLDSSVKRHALLSLLERDRPDAAAALRGETAQVLSMVLVSLAALESCNDVGELQTGMRDLRESIRLELNRIQALAAKLHLSVLDYFGLEPALIESARQIGGIGGPAFQIDVAEGSREIDQAERSLVFRILEEAMRNAVTHADARNVSVKATGGRDLEYAVNDDGRGFDSKVATGRTSSSGLAGMRARASAIGAVFEVRSKRGSGTSVLLKLPRKED